MSEKIPARADVPVQHRTDLEQQESLQNRQGGEFTAEAATLSRLAVLVQVGWADGRISTGERAIILSAAATRNIEWEGPAYFRLLEWIANRPPQRLFDASLQAVRCELSALPSEERSKQLLDLIAACTCVASASGDQPGFGGEISREQDLIDRLSQELQRDGEAPEEPSLG
jgi:hypothetical protein